MVYTSALLAAGRFLPRDGPAEGTYKALYSGSLPPRIHLIQALCFMAGALDVLLSGTLFEEDAFKRTLAWGAVFVDYVSGVTCLLIDRGAVPVYYDIFGHV